MHIATMQDLTAIDSERLEVDRHVHVTGLLLGDMGGMLDAAIGCGN